MAEDIALPGEKLKTFRKEAGLTLKAVADELKYRFHFSMVENGKSESVLKIYTGCLDYMERIWET